MQESRRTISREDKSLRAVLNFDPYAVKSEKLNILCRRPQIDEMQAVLDYFRLHLHICTQSLESDHM